MGKWEEKKNGFYQRFELFAVVVVVVVIADNYVVPFYLNIFILLMADVNVIIIVYADECVVCRCTILYTFYAR